MSSAENAASVPSSKPGPRHNSMLLIGGCFSLAFAVFQVSAIWWSASAIRYFGGPAQFSTEKPFAYALLCLGVAAMAAVAGLYALSGAGKLPRLPLLCTVLIAVTVVYVLRGLLIVPQTRFVLKHPELARFVVFSAISLCVGLVHLGGVVGLFRRGRPDEARIITPALKMTRNR